MPTTNKTAKNPINSLPYSRDASGLVDNIQHVFLEDGSVNWREMIPKKYIVFNEENLSKNLKPYPGRDVTLADVDNPDSYNEKELLILLGGIKEVAKIRGLISRKTKVVYSDPTRVICECELEFLPNYETHNHKYVYSDIASATIENTAYGMHKYLDTIASNRAFVRAVRNALRIDIIGSDELQNLNSGLNSNSESIQITPIDNLKNIASKRNIENFQKMKALIMTSSLSKDDKFKDVESWNDYSDIPSDKVFTLINILNSKK